MAGHWLFAEAFAINLDAGLIGFSRVPARLV
jgi:hypothetical protein